METYDANCAFASQCGCQCRVCTGGGWAHCGSHSLGCHDNCTAPARPR